MVERRGGGPAERQSKMTRAEGGCKGLVSFSFLALFCQTGDYNL
jgi:hypothetical protein